MASKSTIPTKVTTLTANRTASAENYLQRTTDEELEEKMPESVKRFAAAFSEGFGRTFACKKCGTPTHGKCTDCGHTHRELRNKPRR